MIVWYWLVWLITNPRILGSEVIGDGSTNPDAQQNEGTNYFYREVVVQRGKGLAIYELVNIL